MKRETIAAAEIQYFSLDQLYLSDLNPRQDADAEGIDLLADSLAIIGLVQNLSGLIDAAGRVGIVAGGRRLRAIARAIERDPAITEQQPSLAQIPVRVTSDAAQAHAWAAAENTAREDLDPADEIRAYGRMAAAGADVATIARSFAQTEAHVYRRLALASLPGEVLDALKAGEIGLGAAKAFTVAQDRDLALTVLEKARARDLSEHQIKSLLQPEAVSANDRRALFVGLDAYEKAGGTLTRDLFSDHVALHQIDILDRLFAEKLVAETEAVKTEWAWAEMIEDTYIPYGQGNGMTRLYAESGDLTEQQAERYDELAQMAEAGVLDQEGEAELAALDAILEGEFTNEQRRFGGLFLCVSHNGELRRAGPYVRREDHASAVSAGVVTGHAASTASAGKSDEPKSPYSGALVADMQAIRTAAVQGALLDKPELALDLLAFTFSELWGGPLAVRKDDMGIKPTTETGFNPDPRLTGEDDDEDETEAEADDPFDAFRARGKKHRNAVLTLALARSLKYGGTSATFAKVEAETKASVRAIWTPTAENFFSRVSAAYLDALMIELTGTDPAATTFKAFKDQKKAAKAQSLERLFSDADYQAVWQIDAEHKARIAAWLPDCF